MSDHQNYCSNNEVQDIFYQNDISSDESDNINEEKSGDEFLIALYRERPFLYDKKNRDFKDLLMRENAWNEISKTMIETNCGDFYTPDYCQRRCTSLREQYNREKKKIESQSRSGSAASKSTKFPFFSQLTFLDQFIKRRRTYSNVIKPQSNAALTKKNSMDIETYSSDIPTCSSSNKENESTNSSKQTVENFYEDSICSSKLKKRKINETKELEQTFVNMANRIGNYMDNSLNSSKSADIAFMEFIKIQFDSIPEHEKNIRRKMIIDAISVPI